MKIISVVGARPNFMKIAPFCKVLEAYSDSEANETIEHILVHTGQHYDDRMSQSFFDALNIPQADINLGIGSGSHARQVGETMIAFEEVLKEHKPDWVVVVGDVNATCACSITAKKEGIRVAHIEAGLRSFDMDMPEEINRLVTDRLSDLLLTPDEISSENLLKEGVDENKIAFVGNVMIDTLEANRDIASGLDLVDILRDNCLEESQVSKLESISRAPNGYGLITLHRPSNVDDKAVLGDIIQFFKTEATVQLPFVWAIHPRTKKQLEAFGLWETVRDMQNLVLLHPVGYHQLLKMNMEARLVMTDSGGLQEECCVLGTPCLTLRWNTERPVTLQEHGGASLLVGNSVQRVRSAFEDSLSADRKPMSPPLWDGRAAERIFRAIVDAS